MPEPTQILATLTRIANAGVLLAALWHLVAAVAAVQLLRAWRPSRRWAAVLLLAPLVSVSAMAFAYASYFNAVVAATLVLGLLVVALRLGDPPVQRGPTWSRLAGIGMLAFGWFYPHFLESRPWLSYAVAAPMGVLPCPTLAALIGASLLASGFGSKSWSLTLSCAGLFYALFGAIRLGVRLDRSHSGHRQQPARDGSPRVSPAGLVAPGDKAGWGTPPLRLSLHVRWLGARDLGRSSG